MNYRHAYHAGNFADVFKHLVLVLVIEHLKQKPAPFRVIDSHAGAGHYDLTAIEAHKTGEWQSGIGRLLDAEPPADVAAVLAPYLALIRDENRSGPLERYPGSPWVARKLLRRDDSLIANELHPDDRAALEKLFGGDPQTKVMGIDGWLALKALLPPKERRGVVLVDPPFEEPGELSRMAQGLEAAVRRFATGTFLLWYPIKDPRPVAQFKRDLSRLALGKVQAIELYIREPADIGLLNGAGLIVVNPPFTLVQKLSIVLPWLTDVLGDGSGSRFALTSLGTEAIAD